MELNNPQRQATIYQNSSVAIQCVNESVSRYFGRSKHISLRYCYVRDMENEKDIEIVPVTTENMKAGMFTKP